MQKKTFVVALAALCMLAPSVVAAETEYNTPDSEGRELVVSIDAPESAPESTSFYVTVSAYTEAYNASVSIPDVSSWTIKGCDVLGDPESVASAYTKAVTVELVNTDRVCSISVKPTATHDDWTVRGMVSSNIQMLRETQELKVSFEQEEPLRVDNTVLMLEPASTTPVDGEVEVPAEKSGPSALQITAYILFGLVILGGVGWFIYNRVNAGYDDFEDSVEVPVSPIPPTAPQSPVPAPVMPPAPAPAPPVAPEAPQSAPEKPQEE